jgi:hypothetical protein
MSSQIFLTKEVYAIKKSFPAHRLFKDSVSPGSNIS